MAAPPATSMSGGSPSSYDRAHALSAVAALRLGSKVEVSATGRFASGFPYTPIVGLRVIGGERRRDDDRDRNRTELVPEHDVTFLPVYIPDRGGLENLLSARLPAFARVDARVSFRPKGPSGRWLFYLDAINVLDRANVGAYEPCSCTTRPETSRGSYWSRARASRSCRRSASASGSEAARSPTRSRDAQILIDNSDAAPYIPSRGNRDCSIFEFGVLADGVAVGRGRGAPGSPDHARRLWRARRAR